MAKINWDTITLKEAIYLAKTRGTAIQALSTRAASRNQELEGAIRAAGREIYSLTSNLAEAEKLIAELRATLAAGVVVGTHTCSCTNWISAGTNPNNGDKYKQCLDCGRIGVR